MRIQVPEVRFSLQDDECVRNPIEHARGCSLMLFARSLPWAWLPPTQLAGFRNQLETSAFPN